MEIQQGREVLRGVRTQHGEEILTGAKLMGLSLIIVWQHEEQQGYAQFEDGSLPCRAPPSSIPR